MNALWTRKENPEQDRLTMKVDQEVGTVYFEARLEGLGSIRSNLELNDFSGPTELTRSSGLITEQFMDDAMTLLRLHKILQGLVKQGLSDERIVKHIAVTSLLEADGWTLYVRKESVA